MLPGNGIFVVRGEMSTLMTAMRRGSRWNSTAYVDEEKDGLMKSFINLKQILNRVEDLRLIDPNKYLTPFLEIIRTDETTGVVTALALSAINKFLSYGLLDPTTPNLALTVENIADAVTHARFMGTDQSSDGVALFRVVEVLHTLMRSPEGAALTNEAVCEVMLSCFKICFEPRLNELLRRYAEQALKDMVLLVFMRLPQFSEDRSESGLAKKFQMMATSMEKDKKQHRKKLSKTTSITNEITAKLAQEEDPQSPHTLSIAQPKNASLATTPATPVGNILDMQGKITQTPTTTLNVAVIPKQQTEDSVIPPTISIDPASPLNQEDNEPQNVQLDEDKAHPENTHIEDENNEYVNSVGVRFTQQNSIDGTEGLGNLVPYGLPCIQELFRFLILLCNPLDKQNTDTMIHLGLSLLTVAFEVGADNIGKYDALLETVKDDLCRNLISLMSSERLTLFAANLQVCFLLFESLRGHLKFQLEAYLRKLTEIIASDNPKTPYEMRELALDNLLQLWRIPGFVAELYINYDCDLYCTDMFESITNLLSKYTLSATNVVYNTHIIAMDTLLSIIENIGRNCVAAKNIEIDGNNTAVPSSNRHSRTNSGLDGVVIDSKTEETKTIVENISKFLNKSSKLRSLSEHTADVTLSREYLSKIKHKKQILTQGTEIFNQRPDKGIQYLQENGILNTELNPKEVALFLRENPGLDKKMIGEYISKKKNVEALILLNFIESFDFANLRVDQALRLYLETFRLPGEAPLIFLVLEHFADHWHKQNGEPFANTDAAFSLAYAIIMLNMDQHNSNAKRLNVPMVQEDFLKNLRGLNGGADYEHDMLCAVFNAIKNEEIVMPAEQTGLVRENYLWKVLLRRGNGPDSIFNYVEDSTYDVEIFKIIWGASLSALSFMFDKSNENGYQRTLAGFTKCACISAHYNLSEDFDALILTLCKFTTLLSTTQPDNQLPTHNEITQAVNFGLNPKAQAAMRTIFALVHDYGDCLRDSWKNILDLVVQLFRLKLLPKSLMEVEDFCEANGKAMLILEKPNQKQDAGLFSSLRSYLSSEGQREPSEDESHFINIGKKCIKECQLDQMIQESKFVQFESLQELVKFILLLIKPPNAHKSLGLLYAEDVVVFWMEFLVKIVIHNRDRMIPLWTNVRDNMYLLLMDSASYGYDYLLNRSIVAVLKLAIYLMRNEELCPPVLESLKMLLMLKPNVLLRISNQIAIGIFELLKTSAQNIHTEQDWQIIFTILECVGTGAIQPDPDFTNLPLMKVNETKSDGALSSEEETSIPDRGYISDTELGTKELLKQNQQGQQSNAGSPYPSSPTAENWILVNKDTDLTNLSRPQSPPNAMTVMSSSLVYKCKLGNHSPFALFKCWDSLAFIVRNVAHITPFNFESCVRCIRTFVEACRDGGIRQRRKFQAEMSANAGNNNNKKLAANKRHERETQRKLAGSPITVGSASAGAGDFLSKDVRNDVEEEDLAQRYETLSIQLLDLMYTLYTRTAQIFRWWAEECSAVPQCSALWAQGWCPLLQSIARLATDRRREVRTYAISCLQQRALLVHDLQTLSGVEWALCFHQVLFPLLNEVLPDSPSIIYLDSILLEESRIRTATIMSKVFLHHLTPLIDLQTAFNDLWMEILDYIEKFMKVGSDMLSEQMQEILKNMLLVMHSVRIFHNNDGTLWELTWRRIGEFLPNLKDDLFRDEGGRFEMINKTSAGNKTVMDYSAIPNVEILSNSKPKSIEKLPQMVSPVESPKHSIILQPPNAHLIQGQSILLGEMTNLNMPMLVPQPTIAIKTDMVSDGSNGGDKVKNNTILNTKILPDLVSDASKIVTNQQETLENINNVVEVKNDNKQHECNSFLIELPETPPIIEEEQQQANLNDDLKTQEEQYQLYYQQYHQQMLIQQKLQNVSLNNMETDAITATTNDTIKQTNAFIYAEANKNDSTDIFQEYVQNPYNVISDQQQQQQQTQLIDAEQLYSQQQQQHQQHQLQQQQQQQQQQYQHTNLLYTTPANYFNANVDPNAIPPGSEVLFGQP